MRDIPETALEALARVVADTVSDEISCDELLNRISAYVERAAAGAADPSLIKAVDDHLRICPECTEEYDALLKALGQDPEVS